MDNNKENENMNDKCMETGETMSLCDDSSKYGNESNKDNESNSNDTQHVCVIEQQPLPEIITENIG